MSQSSHAESHAPRFALRRRAPYDRSAGSGALAAVAVAESALIRLVCRLVLAAASLIAALIGLAIALRLLGANVHNGVAHAIHTAANFFAGSFTTLFTIHHASLSLLINWGIALCVYLLAGMVVAGVVARVGRAITPRTAVTER
jgi:hypothetical protein